MQLFAEALVPGTAGVAPYQPLAHPSSTTELALVRQGPKRGLKLSKNSQVLLN